MGETSLLVTERFQFGFRGRSKKYFLSDFLDCWDFDAENEVTNYTVLNWYTGQKFPIDTLVEEIKLENGDKSKKH